jgi:hypothetical protein
MRTLHAEWIMHTAIGALVAMAAGAWMAVALTGPARHGFVVLDDILADRAVEISAFVDGPATAGAGSARE